jgi:uncharacterized membrane protein
MIAIALGVLGGISTATAATRGTSSPLRGEPAALASGIQTVAQGTPAGGGAAANLPLVIGLVLVILALVAGILYRSGMLDQSVAATTDAEASTPETASEQRTDPELLSDEDRVRRLLQENDGRMKQVRIVEETDWSKSKVSMLLSEMEEAGTINKLRVGRENIISLEGEEPDAAGSPFPSEE